MNLDRDMLQQQLQARLRKSLASSTSKPAATQHEGERTSVVSEPCISDSHSAIAIPRGKLLDISANEIVPQHAGPRSACLPGLDVPLPGLPQLRDPPELPASFDADSVAFSKRLRRETRRRARLGSSRRHRQHLPAAAGSAPMFRDEAHRLRSVLHSVLEASDGEFSASSGCPNFSAGYYDEDESYLYSD